MQLTAKIEQVLTPVTGESKNGKWKKQDVIVEINSNFQKKLCLTLWGDKFDTNLLVVGTSLNFNFDIESNESNGRWFTNTKVWKIESINGSTQIEKAKTDSIEIVEPPATYNFLDNSDDESLPF